jgi:thiosulfate/3-mercaptopyruvate sulfurtransferase
LSESLPRLLEPEQLGQIPRAGLLVVHVAEAAAYRQAHLPGAVLVEPRAMVSGAPPAPGRLPEERQLAELFSGIGYRPDLHIVVYDDEGGGWAGRLIWTLDIIGHSAWSYLNGGIQAWHAAGLPLESGPGAQPSPTTVSLKLNRWPIAERADVLAAIGDPGQIIWDVRSAEEYRGERSGARRAGHVPTAVHLDWMALKDPARQLRLTRNLPELLAAHGIDAGKRIITHCQTHHRSGLSYLVGRLLGFRDIRGYHGSWADWGNAEDTPIATGPAPGEPPEGWGAEPTAGA